MTLLIGSALSACAAASDVGGRGQPPRFSEYCPPPGTASDDWRTGSPADHGLRATDIESLVQAARSGRLGKLHGILVVKDGVLVVEEYLGGARREHCQLIASVTKSMLSILLGTSLERDTSVSVETPLARFFPEYADALRQQGKSAITLAHALTMTAGFDWDEYTYPHPDPRNPNTQMYEQSDPKRFILGRDLVHAPGETWTYNSGLSVILGAVVERITGLSVDKFAARELFQPLGIDRYHWFKHPDGTVYSNGDLLLTPRDLAKIGLLVLQQGEWRGRRIVSRRWLADSTRARIASGQDLGYGYHWWRGSVVRGGREIDVLFASGTGGQRLFIVADLNLVVVVTQQVFDNRAGPMRAAEVLADYVIPAALPPADEAPATVADAAILEAAVGTYVNERHRHAIRVVRDGAVLFLEPEPGTRVELTPVGPRRFRGFWARIGKLDIEFEAGEQGDVAAATARFMLRTRHYRRAE